MASIAGLYGGFGGNQEEGTRGNIFVKFKKDLIKEQASQAAARRDE